jgi:O-antigen/teichoic acid export membrane protein
LSRILRGGFTGLVGRGAALLVSAVTLPLTVRYLGRLEYGVWVTISTSVVMLAVLDLGIANTLTNFISKAYSDNDDLQAQRYFATAFWLTVVLVGFIGAGAFFAWRVIHWGTVFHLSDPVLIAHARACAAISICFFLIGIPLGLANRVLSGYQQIHISNYFAMANSVLGLIAIVTVVLLHGSIVALMAAFCLAMLTGSLALNFWLFFWYKPFLKPLPSRADRTLAKGFLGEGSLFFLLQLSTLVVFNSDNLVITHFLGAGEVTPYSVAWRLTNYASMMQSLLIPSLWPAFSEAYHRRDMQWVRNTYRNATRSSLLAVGLVAALIGLAGRPLIHLWAGSAAVPGSTLLWCMAGWAVLVSMTTNQALLLTATGRLKLEAAVAVIAAIANLYLSIYLVTRIGSTGVILATMISFLVVMIGPQEWEVRRVLAGKYLPNEVAVSQDSLNHA